MKRDLQQLWGVGNSLANQIWGNLADNNVSGLSGADTILANDGSDTVSSVVRITSRAVLALIFYQVGKITTKSLVAMALMLSTVMQEVIFYLAAREVIPCPVMAALTVCSAELVQTS